MSTESRISRALSSLGKSAAALFLSGMFATTVAAPGNETAELYATTGAPASELPSHASLLRNQSIQLNHDALEFPALSFDLLGEAVTAIRDRLSEREKGSFTWIGHIEGEAGSEVILTLHGQAVAGTIRSGGKLYELRQSPLESVVYEVDRKQLPADAHEAAPLDSSGTIAASELPATNGTVHDLMVLYTQQACGHYKGCTALEAMILNSVETANVAYSNSQVGIQLHVVHMGKINYNESGDMTRSLYDLTYTGGTFSAMDTVQDLRDSYGADLVSLVTEDTNSCGVAWVNGSVSADYAYNVVYSGCLGDLTLAHELGHSQGDHHDRANADPTGAHEYSYGYRQCEAGGFHTVMAYPCSYIGENGDTVETPHISNFSNPNVYYNGRPTGIDHALDPDHSADNARSMNNTAATVAAFRLSVSPTVPAAPYVFSATALSYSRARLDWLDTASDESGYLIERLGGSTSLWEQVALLPANSSYFEDTGLSSSTAYFYRVRTYNGTGNSDYSNTVSVITPSQPEIFDDYATGEIPSAGTVSGDYTSTYGINDDGGTESIQEVRGIRGRNAYSYLQHTWTFMVSGGSTVTLHALAYSGGSGDGDAFNFSYSVDGVNFSPLFTISPTETLDTAAIRSIDLPAGINGPLYIRVTDSSQSKGNTSYDTLYVNQLYIRSHK